MNSISLSVIGAANVDLYGVPFNKLILKSSNPGRIKIGFGGVGRNVSENLVRIGVGVNFLTVLGDDLYGHKILEHSKGLGINMEHSLISANASTATYFAILNEDQDMALAIIDAEIMEEINRKFVQSRLGVIKQQSICLLDTNLPKDTITAVLDSYPEGRFFLDPVSCAKADKVVDVVGKFYAVKPNKLEAEVLTGITIQNKEDLLKASEILLNKGVKKVFISMDKEGVFYNDGISYGIIQAIDVMPKNAAGAGDAFTAAIIYGELNGMEMTETTRFATAPVQLQWRVSQQSALELV